MVETSVILPPDYKPSADEEYMNLSLIHISEPTRP